jgi:hypothetical protein
MKKVYNTWLVSFLIIVVVALYHLYSLTEKYEDPSNILGTDQNAQVNGTLSVGSRRNNKIGNSFFANEKGNVEINPADNGDKVVLIGHKARFNIIGPDPNTINTIGEHTWIPHFNGNTYIRPGRNGADVHIGDLLASTVQIGAGAIGNRIGQDTWLPAGDGNAYIRPNKFNGVVNIGDYKANQINIGNNNAQTNIRGQLCMDNVCLNAADFRRLRG